MACRPPMEDEALIVPPRSECQAFLGLCSRGAYLAAQSDSDLVRSVRMRAVVTEGELDQQVRLAMFAYLEVLTSRSLDGTVTWADLKQFTFNGTSVHLLGPRGIWKPSGLEAALTITTTYTPPNQQPPYADTVGIDGLIRYKYQGESPQNPDNVALRRAMASGAGLAYFIGVAKGVYVPRWPVCIVGEDPAQNEFAIAVDEGLRLLPQTPLDAPQRAYRARLIQERLHQPVFRSRVLRAYQSSCAMCCLRHAELLDAAHIIADGHLLSDPVVPNGLALCKITTPHSTPTSSEYDPIWSWRSRPGSSRRSMGRCSATAFRRCRVPDSPCRAPGTRPDSERLEQRYEDFRAAS